MTTNRLSEHFPIAFSNGLCGDSTGAALRTNAVALVITAASIASGVSITRTLHVEGIGGR